MAVCARTAVSRRRPLVAERGRIIARRAGRWRANTRAPTRQQRPPIRTIWGAVSCIAMLPATRLPTGAIPIKAMVDKRMLHPGPDRRETLARDIETIIPRPEGTKEAPQACGAVGT